MKLFLNAFRIGFSKETFEARVRPLTDASEVHEYRRKYGEKWYFHWSGGNIYTIHKTAPREKIKQMSDSQELSVKEHLPLLAARLVNSLPTFLTDCKPVRYRPFQWTQDQNFMWGALNGISDLAPVLRKFYINPRCELDAKVVELTEGREEIILTFNRGTQWRIKASIAELVKSGINPEGLMLVRRGMENGKRRLVGSIGSVDGETIHLSGAFDDVSKVQENEVWIEGSLASFAHCLKVLLKDQYETYQSNLDGVLTVYQSARKFESMLSSVEKTLRNISPFYIGGGLEVTIGERIQLTNTPSYKSVLACPTVEYCFDAARTKRDPISWRGLTKYGPFSHESFPKKTPTIVVFFPDTVERTVENYICMLRDGIQLPGGKASAYAGGLEQIYGFANLRFIRRKIPWLDRSKDQPAKAYREAVEAFLAENLKADLALVALLDEHSDLPDPVNPYLTAKAYLLMGGIPVQEIRYSKLKQPENNLQYISQDISVAMYAKMSGTPWTVDHDRTVDDEIVIGMGMCEIQSSRFDSRKRYMGITTVFLGDGSYLVSNISQECLYEDYPEELRQTTLTALRAVKERNGWRPGNTVRVVFHIPKPLKNIEVAEITARCVEEMCSDQVVEFSFLTINQQHPYLLTDKHQLGTGYNRTRGQLVPDRGTVVQVDTFQRLLVTQGPNQIKVGHSGIPDPLLIKLHDLSNHRDLQGLSEQVLRFTSMTWRSTRPASIPVTILYSEEIARLLVRLKAIDGWSPAVLRGKLKSSRWFL